ncbi:MAG: ABC transporter ATP-binding protein/permease [Candidatus Binatia bacterium]|nr:ABC transporter ATP-binding protein/permease [Candidatus Binatia bacterium]
MLRSLAPYKGRFVVGLAQVALITALELAKPWPLKIAIDYVLPNQPPPWLPASIGRQHTLLLIATVGLVAIYGLLGAVQVWNNYTTIAIGQSMVADLRSKMYEHLQRLSLSFHTRASVGDLIYRVTSDTYAIQTLAMNGVFPVLASACLLTGMFAVLVQMDWLLTLMAAGVCPALVAVLFLMERKLTDTAREARERESEVYEHVHRTMSAVKVVQAFSKEAEEHADFTHRSAASLRAHLRLYLWQTAFGASTGLLLAAGSAAVLWFGAQRVWTAGLSAGDLVVFLNYLASLYSPLHAIFATYGSVQGARAGLRRVLELLATTPEVQDGHRVLSWKPAGRVRFEHVSFAYEPTKPALVDIDFEVEPGQVVAIVGPTGAGKSTLVSLVPRFYDPGEGRVLLDDVDVREFTLHSLRQVVTMVLQPPIVFPVSVRENIAYGRPDASTAEIERAAKLAQAHAFIERLPQGYDTTLGSQGATLSEGEKQRLTIARALLRDAPILILDEPTSSVDLATEAAIIEALRAAMRGKTTFVIAHRLPTVQQADLILVLDRGHIVERGTFEELLARRGFFHHLYSHGLVAPPPETRV